jgi:putative membrane protein
VFVTNRVSVTLALLSIGVAWFGPLQVVTGGPFSAHMTAHMALVAIASPLIAIALSNSRFDPVSAIPWLFAAIPASLLELVVVSAWHAPAFHHAARQRFDMFVFEQASFLFAGLLLWVSVLGGNPKARTRRSGSGIVALLLTFGHMTLLGALLALTPRPLYHHAGAPSLLSPLADQQLGGTIMLVIGGLSYIGGGLWLSHGLLRRTRTLVEG